MAPRPIYYDTETTGVKPAKDRIIELAAYDVERNCTFCSFVNPEGPIPAESSAISGITDEMVKDAPLFKDVAPAFSEFCEGEVVLIAHNNDQFDKLFLENEYARCGHIIPSWLYFDTLKWSRKYRPDLRIHTFDSSLTCLVIVTNLDPDSRVLAEHYANLVEEFAALELKEYGLRRFIDELQMKDAKLLSDPVQLARYVWL